MPPKKHSTTVRPRLGSDAAKKKKISKDKGKNHVAPTTNGVGPPGTPPTANGKSPGLPPGRLSSPKDSGLGSKAAVSTPQTAGVPKIDNAILGMLGNPTADKDKNENEEDQGETEAELAEQKRRHERMMKVLAGHLKDLPPLSKKVMRIFTSSTFTGKCFVHLFIPYTMYSINFKAEPKGVVFLCSSAWI